MLSISISRMTAFALFDTIFFVFSQKKLGLSKPPSDRQRAMNASFLLWSAGVTVFSADCACRFPAVTEMVSRMMKYEVGNDESMFGQ